MSGIVPRREFVKKVTAASLGLGVTGVQSPAILAGGSANEKVVVAIMGTNSRGAALAEGFARLPGAEVAYICDVDDQAMAKGLAAVQKGGQQKKPKGVKDFR